METRADGEFNEVMSRSKFIDHSSMHKNVDPVRGSNLHIYLARFLRLSSPQRGVHAQLPVCNQHRHLNSPDSEPQTSSKHSSKKSPLLPLLEHFYYLLSRESICLERAQKLPSMDLRLCRYRVRDTTLSPGPNRLFLVHS